MLRGFLHHIEFRESPKNIRGDCMNTVSRCKKQGKKIHKCHRNSHVPIDVTRTYMLRFLDLNAIEVAFQAMVEIDFS